MSVEGLPPAVVLVVAVVGGTLVGALLWRLFKVALKLVFFVVFVVVATVVLAWNQPVLLQRISRAAGLGANLPLLPPSELSPSSAGREEPGRSSRVPSLLVR